MSTVTVNEKKEFIKWFLGHYQIKKREPVWILNYLMSHDEIIKNIHFVEQAQYSPRSMIISTTCSDDVTFRFYDKGVMSTDAEKAFHHIRTNQEDLYIQLNFNDKTELNYLEVVEDNPFVPEEHKSSNQYKRVAENFLEHSLSLFKREQLQKQIDKALESGNKELFISLSNKLSEVPMINKKFELIKGRG